VVLHASGFRRAALRADGYVAGERRHSDTLTPTIEWTGDTHDRYEVHVTQVNDPNTTTNGWDSGQVVSSGNSA